MNHGSLFSGIGGFDLASEWMGWDNVFHCEWNEFGQKVLKHYWPEAKSYEDITKTDFSIWRNRIDILTGGFPCQPYSAAGRRLGKEDDRHLWPEMLRVIGEVSPRWVVGENVRGLTNWNGGLVFDEVQADLEAKGYEITPFLLPACAVNAPHRRDRIWFVANSNNAGAGIGMRINTDRPEENKRQIRQSQFKPRSNGRDANAPDTESERGGGLPVREKQEYPFNGIVGSNGIITDTNSRRQSGKEYGEKESGRFAKKGVSGNWQNFPTQSPVCNGDDGFSSRLDGITFSKWRNESIKAGGNAIVPQVAHQIFKAIEQYDNLSNTQRNSYSNDLG